MGEAWKLLTAQFTFTAATLTLVVFIFINVNMAIYDLKLIIPQLQDAVNLVPNIKLSIQNATETAGSTIMTVDDMIESAVSKQQADLLSFQEKFQEFHETVVQELSKIEETTKLLTKICEQLGCNAG